jgi:hypothetical protein
VVLFWLIRRSGSNRTTDLPRGQSEVGRFPTSPAEQLATPGNNRLAHRQEIWEQRRKHAAHISASDSDSHGQVKFRSVPEYDGYSRRDRQHLAPANVKQQERVENPTMTAVKFEQDPPSEKTQAKG